MKISLYESIKDAWIHPSEVIDITFEQFCSMAADSIECVEDKTTVKMFNLCSWIDDFEHPSWANPRKTPYPETELIKRCKDNVKEIYALLLDVDGTKTIAEAEALWGEYEYFIYSTHRHHTKETNYVDKFRIVMPLATPMTAEEFTSRRDAMIEYFGVDKASFTISQAFYLPSCSSENQAHAFARVNPGVRFDGLQFAEQEISYNKVEFVLEPGFRDPIATAILKTLMSGSNLHYPDAMPLAVVCKSKGITETEFYQLARSIAAPGHSISTGEADLVTVWKKAYAAQLRNDTVLKLMRTLNCNMWRWGG